MKKKCDFLPPRGQRWKFNFSLRMRLLVTLLLVGALHVSANSVAQTKVSLTMKNAAVEEVFQRLESMTGYTFLYNLDLLKGCGRVDVDARDEDFSQLLAGVLKPLGLAFTIDDRVVVITRDDEKKAPKELIIKGRVLMKDSTNLPGATVIVKGTSVGVVTDNNGRFTLSVLNVENPVLVFSFVGLKKKEVKYEGKEMLVVMEEETHKVDEVVVTGYGNVAKGNYTGASTTVKAEDIMMAGVSSVDQMLQGVVPGMLVMNTTGQVGATPKIRVRGTSTLLGSQEPVWVVDGVIQRDPQPFNSDENTSFSVDADDIKELAGNAISWLNPNDIETITVLKDASATAIYGSQAANGVIVITTKKATAGRVQVSYSGDFSIGQRPRYGLYDLMNSAEIMQLQKDIYDERRTYSSSILPIGYAGLVQKMINKEITASEMNTEYKKLASLNTDWFDLLFRNSLNHSHNISISGGSDKVQNRTSFGYVSEKGEAKGNEMSMFTATSNTTVRLGSKLTVDMLLKGSIRNVEGFAYGVDPFTYAYGTSRAIAAYDEDGTYYFYQVEGEYNGKKELFNYNILNELANTGSENVSRSLGVSVDLKWKIIPCLEYQGLFSYSNSSSDSKQWASEESFYITKMRGYEYGTATANSVEYNSSPLPHGGILETDLTNVYSVMVRNSLVYDQVFKDKHRVTLQLGVETNSVKTKGNTSLRYGYLPDRGETFATPPLTYLDPYGDEIGNSDIQNGSASVLNRKENTLSEYASAIYTYDDRYVVNVNARVDASNRFGQDKNKRFEPTWSVGVKWRATNEKVLYDVWWLNNMDIYASFGYQGNAVTSVSPYLIAYDNGLDTRYNEFTLRMKSLPYPDLGWEKTRTYNIGVDASLLKGRLNMTFNYYRKSSDVLSSRAIPYENGTENGIVSGSTMKNYGYDLVIDVVPMRTPNFTWQLSLNTGVAHNSVDKNKRVNTLNDYLSGECIVDGEPYSTFYSYKFAGLNPENGHPTFEYMDVEGASGPIDYLVKSGKFVPDFSGGLNTMFKYKGWSLYALFAVQWGGYGRLPEYYSGATDTNPGLPRPEENVSRDLKKRWKQPGDEKHTNIPSLPGTGYEDMKLPATATSTVYNSNLYHMYNMSDERVAKTDFVRCRSISLSYEFGKDCLEKLSIQRMQLKASMTNPFLWVRDKDWNGLDPETGNWPARRVASLSLQIIL